MDHAANLGSWGELYVMLGTSSAALLGLLFVAASLHLADLTNNPGYATRARYNNYFLLLTLFEAVCILTSQPPAALGAELVVANLLLFLITFSAVYRLLYRSPALGKSAGMSHSRSTAFLIAFLGGAIGGLFVFFNLVIGLYIVTATYFVVLVTVALNAWSIMTGIGQADQVTKRRAVKRRR